jgi:excisionase family DNA binding protein
MWSGRLATAPDRSYAMSTSPNLHLTGPVNRDIFDSLESCEKLLTAREVARILSISEKTVYSYVSRNLIPHYKIEANVRFRARDIANWLRRHASLIQPVMASRKAAVRT